MRWPRTPRRTGRMAISGRQLCHLSHSQVMEPLTHWLSPVPDRRPDAVIFPRPRTGPDVPEDVKIAAVEVAEDRLQCEGQELAWVRDQQGYSGHYFFATRCPEDTEFFPVGHPMEKQSRYRWTD